MGLLRIETIKLQQGINYLGSGTILVIATRNGLISFYDIYNQLYEKDNNSQESEAA